MDYCKLQIANCNWIIANSGYWASVMFNAKRNISTSGIAGVRAESSICNLRFTIHNLQFVPARHAAGRAYSRSAGTAARSMSINWSLVRLLAWAA